MTRPVAPTAADGVAAASWVAPDAVGFRRRPRRPSRLPTSPAPPSTRRPGRTRRIPVGSRRRPRRPFPCHVPCRRGDAGAWRRWRRWLRPLRLLRWLRRSAIRRRPAGSVVRRSVRSRRLRLCCHSTPGCRDPRVAPFDRCEGDRGGPGCIGARSATGFGDTTGSRASRAAERRAFAVHQIRSFRGCVLARRPVPRAARRGRASLDSSMTPHGATSAAAGGHVYGEDSSTRLARSHPPNAPVGHPSHSGCPPQEPHVGRIPHVRGGAHPSKR